MEVITLGATFVFLFIFFIIGGGILATLVKNTSPPATIIEEASQEKSNREPLEVIALKAKLLTLHKKVNSMTPEQVKEVDFVISSF